MNEIILDCYEKKVETLLNQWYKNIDTLTIEALKSNNIDFDFEKYRNSRFKFFIAVTDERDNSYTVYFNDGSVDGLKLFSIPNFNITPTFKTIDNFKDNF